MTKKILFLLCLAVSLIIISAASAQDPVRVKCGSFTMNVPSVNVKCYQVEGNIPVSETASPEEIANAQVANTAIYFSNYESLQSSIPPQVTFYLIDDLGKTSFDLLDIGFALSDTISNIDPEYATVEEVYQQVPFLPYQILERTANGLPLQLNFATGSGIRTVVSFAEYISAISGNSNLYYSYQGVSSDGRYYISAVFPLRSAVLNGQPAAEINWNSLSSGDFQPSLDELDYYVRSIVIE